MASSNSFPLFSKLPTELRFIIWEISVLDHHRDRLVLLNESTKRVICFRKLACSPHFRATSESRKVAMNLYPVRLPVYRMLYTGYNKNDQVNNNEVSIQPLPGAIYVNLARDIFTLNLKELAKMPLSRHGGRISGGVENLRWRSAALSPSQCQSVRRIMLFNCPGESPLLDGCRRTAYCTIRCGNLAYDDIWHDACFLHVKECIYVVLNEDVADEIDVYKWILEMTGRSVIKLLEEKEWLAAFSAEEVKRLEISEEVSTCFCNRKQSQG